MSYLQIPREAVAPTPLAVARAAGVVLTALFLPGGPRGFSPPRRRWPEMLHALRAEGSSLASSAWALRRWGFVEEALILESPGLLAWAEAIWESGKALTAACPAYPDGWRRRLGAGAPPAVWVRGAMPPPPYLAVVGSRVVGPAVRRWAHDAAVAGIELGYSVVSGAAAGCDRAAAAGAGRRPVAAGSRGEFDSGPPPVPLAEVLPCGLSLRREAFLGAALSPFGPADPFSGPAAMIRNALIYAMADAAVVVHCRFGEGGTWRGATEAIRRGYCPLIVFPGADPASRRAARALVGLGAVALDPVPGVSPAVAVGIAELRARSNANGPFEPPSQLGLQPVLGAHL